MQISVDVIYYCVDCKLFHCSFWSFVRFHIIKIDKIINQICNRLSIFLTYPIIY
jgi:hypothetical protein